MKLLKIKLSSMRLWVWLDGDKTKKPMRCFANADGIVHTGLKQIPKGESFSGWQPVEYSAKAVIEIRDGWDGFYENPDQYYGKLEPMSA